MAAVARGSEPARGGKRKVDLFLCEFPPISLVVATTSWANLRISDPY